MRKLLLAFAATAILSGCTTTPVPDSKAKQVPNERIYYHPENVVGTGTIAVTRDSGFTGGVCYFALYLDGVLAAKFDTEERAEFKLLPGEHIIGIGNPGGGGVCGFDKGSRKEMLVVVRENETKKYRVVIRPGVGADIEPTTQL